MGLKEWQQGSYQADAVTTTWTGRTVETRLRVGFGHYKVDIAVGHLSGLTGVLIYGSEGQGRVWEYIFKF